MFRFKIFVVLLGALLLTGCFDVPSIHPLFTEGDLMFEPALVGIWTDKNGELLVVRQSGQEKAYKVLHVSGKDLSAMGKYDVYLAQLGEFRFLDILPEENSEYIPSHYFASLRLEKEQMRIAFPDSKWLRQQIIEARAPAHTLLPRRDQKMVLTAPTRELQQMIRKYAAEPKAYDKGGLEFRRMK